jgi:hypothetical protein
MNTAEITIQYEPASALDILQMESPDTLAEIEYVRKESEEIAELRRIVLETTETQPLLCTTT